MEILILLVLMAVAVFVVGSIFVVPLLFLSPVVLGPVLGWIAKSEVSILGINLDTKDWGCRTTEDRVGVIVFLNGLVMGSILVFYAYFYRGASDLGTHWQALFSLLIPPGCGVSAWVCYVIGTEFKARKNSRK